MLKTALIARETSAPYLTFTERHLHTLWAEQKYFKNLHTLEGDPIEVIFPGYWNRGKGPTFLKAHLRIGNREIRGNIEFHLSLLDRDLNPSDGVILRVFLWNNLAFTPKGRVPQVCLEPFLTISKSHLLKLIESELYPYKKFEETGRCEKEIFQSFTDEETLNLFKTAAFWRLEQKKTHFEKISIEREIQFALGVAQVLGYKQNVQAFSNIFLNLIKLSHLPEEALFTLSLSACGFFEDSYCKRWAKSDKYMNLKGYSMMLSFFTSLPAVKICLHQISPLNHPIRRLVYLAKFIASKDALSLYKRMSEIWESLHPIRQWNTLRDSLLNAIPDYQDPYWNKHFLFESESHSDSLPLLGVGTKLEILLHAFFPLLHDEIHRRNKPEEKEAFQAFYEFFPASLNSKTKYLTHRFFGNTSKGELLNRAVVQQGAFQIHRDYCTHYEANCEGCPFVDRYKKRTVTLH